MRKSFGKWPTGCCKEETGRPCPRTLTEREDQVLRGVFEGLTNKEIGTKIGVSEDFGEDNTPAAVPQDRRANAQPARPDRPRRLLPHEQAVINRLRCVCKQTRGIENRRSVTGLTRLRCLRHSRQGDIECGAFVRCALSPHRSPVEADNSLYDSKAHTGPGKLLL